MPWEHQLRALLGDRFAALERVRAGEIDGYAVVLTDGSRHVDVEPERAYALAVLAVALSTRTHHHSTSATTSLIRQRLPRRYGGTERTDGSCRASNDSETSASRSASDTSYVAKSSRVPAGGAG